MWTEVDGTQVHVRLSKGQKTISEQDLEEIRKFKQFLERAPNIDRRPDSQPLNSK